ASLRGYEGRRHEQNGRQAARLQQGAQRRADDRWFGGVLELEGAHDQAATAWKNYRTGRTRAHAPHRPLGRAARPFTDFGAWGRARRGSWKVEVTMSNAPALPAHVAIIMDGNGRWAAERGLPRLVGHRRGADAVRRVVRAARELGLPALTLYAFSAQNWRRPRAEVGHLMRLLRAFVIDEAAELMARGIRIVTVGDLARLP